METTLFREAYRPLRQVQPEKQTALEEIVATLPSTDAASVAQFLMDKGVRGAWFAPARCPVAHYLQDVLELPRGTTRLTATKYAIRWIYRGVSYRVTTPPAVAELIQKFDRGAFLLLHE